jgi:hypothetical protein
MYQYYKLRHLMHEYMKRVKITKGSLPSVLITESIKD